MQGSGKERRSHTVAMCNVWTSSLGLLGGMERAYLPFNVAPFKVNRSVATRAFAGVLAVGLLIFELLATSGRFHQALHCSGTQASNTCVICLFAKGHLDAPPAPPIASPPVQISFESAPRIESIILVDSRYALSPPRGPPVSNPSLTFQA